MRTFWNDRAIDNAPWYVDTSLDFDHPDMGRFFETGRRIVADALDDPRLAPRRRGLAVEIGSGLGRVCLALAERFDEVVGIDIAPEMVRRARELVRDPRVRFELGDGGSLRVTGDQTADLVLSFTVFQHIPDPAVTERYIHEAGRVLRQGGVLVFQWNNEPGARRWRLRRTLLSAMQRSGLRSERRGRHAAEFLGSKIPLDRVCRALEDSGLRLIATKNEGKLYAWAWALKE
jgi:SAM-dependent methyltransferase